MEKICGKFMPCDLGFSEIYLSNFLDFFDFSYLKNQDGTIELIDNQEVNLGNIEEDRFSADSEGIRNIVERLDTYYDDYLFNNIGEVLEEEKVEPISDCWDDLYEQSLFFRDRFGKGFLEIMTCIFFPELIILDENTDL